MDIFKQSMVYSLMLSDKCSSTINALIVHSIKNIEREIEEMYYKYKERYNLTDEEALAYMKQKLTPSEIQYYVNKGLLAQADAVSVGNNINRLIVLKKYIATSFNIVQTQSTFHLEKLLTDISTISSARTHYAVGKKIGFIIDFQKMPKKKMEKLLHHDWLGSNFYKRIQHNCGTLQQKVEQVMTDGILRGKSIDYMAKELSDISNYGISASRRLVRTESARFHNDAEKESLKEMGLQKYRWNSSLDNRTCTCKKDGMSCSKLDGKVFALDDKDAPTIPNHPNCRCYISMVLEGEELKSLKRKYKVYNEQDKELIAKINKAKAKARRELKKAKASGDKDRIAKAQKAYNKAFRRYKIGEYRESEGYITFEDYRKLMNI